MSARNQNVLRISLVTFCNWCVDKTEVELATLIDATARCPLLYAMLIRRGKRKGQPLAKVKDEDRARLEALGRERALVYKTLVLTGLRKNELATLAVTQIQLEGGLPHLELDDADEKSREGNRINLRDYLAEDIRGWLAYKLAAVQAEAALAGLPPPDRLPEGYRIFTIPYELVKILDRDLKAAGIPKRDEQGWTLDVHALRATFGTMLGKGTTLLRTAQSAMRHSGSMLTARFYTDPKLLEVRPSLDALPALPLGKSGQGPRPLAAPSGLAHQLAMESDSRRHSESTPVETDSGKEARPRPESAS
jgi:integrase